jgi:hypothetical protein
MSVGAADAGDTTPAEANRGAAVRDAAARDANTRDAAAKDATNPYRNIKIHVAPALRA